MYSITPTQCRNCKTIYISTSAENTDSNITCLLCGRRSHKECYKDYTIDNDVGVVFMCDPCLSKAETALVLPLENSPLTNTPNTEANTPKEKNGESQEQNEAEDESIEDEICPLYKENSCPHGLTGKREINGSPCPGKHPRKCHYHTRKYGSSGCRYSAKRCPYFHPALCENSLKLQICLIDECKKYHIIGTDRVIRNSKKQQGRNQQRHSNQPKSTNQTEAQPQMWNSQETTTPSQETHDNGGSQSFLTYLHHMKADMQKQLQQQAEMQQQMKADIENSVKNLLRESLQQKPQAEPNLTLQPQFENLQNAHIQRGTNVIPHPQMIQNPHPYQHMFPVMLPNQR